MSKKLVIAVAAVSFLLVVACFLGAVSFMFFRGSYMPLSTVEQNRMDVRLIDEDHDGVPDRGVAEIPLEQADSGCVTGRTGRFSGGAIRTVRTHRMSHASGPFSFIVHGFLRLVGLGIVIVLIGAAFSYFNKRRDRRAE